MQNVYTGVALKYWLSAPQTTHDILLKTYVSTDMWGMLKSHPGKGQREGQEVVS